MSRKDDFALIFMDRHIVPELSYTQFDWLKEMNRPVKFPEYTFAVSDHSVHTRNLSMSEP